MAKTKIKVAPDGTVTILDVCGMGRGCIEGTKTIEAAFGQAVESSRQLTEHYYEEEIPPIELEQTGEDG